VRGTEHSSPFSAFASAKAKFLLLGQIGSLPANLAAQARSLHPALLVQQEISRRTRSALPRDVSQLHLALLRKWFWARKPDAGFLLEGFPATLLQALVFDEWLEARGENLTACLAAASAPADVVTHYRTQGLACEVFHAAA
jgi:adenylate kinase